MDWKQIGITIGAVAFLLFLVYGVYQAYRLQIASKSRDKRPRIPRWAGSVIIGIIVVLMLVLGIGLPAVFL